ncbi:hypothetical protein PAJ34TS1_03850 [Paenibacillus azoreducens]
MRGYIYLIEDSAAFPKMIHLREKPYLGWKRTRVGGLSECLRSMFPPETFQVLTYPLQADAYDVVFYENVWLRSLRPYLHSTDVLKKRTSEA